MTRLDQAFLFPLAYLAVIAIDDFRVRFNSGVKIILVFIFPLFLIEAAMTSMGVSSKDSWRQRYLTLDKIVPKALPDDSILFFAQRSGPPFADELDAMWVSMNQDKNTLNGYSGFFPPGYDYEYGSDCEQITKRVNSYLRFSNQSENHDAYRRLMSRIVPIGFHNCNTFDLQMHLSVSIADHAYIDN